MSQWLSALALRTTVKSSTSALLLTTRKKMDTDVLSWITWEPYQILSSLLHECSRTVSTSWQLGTYFQACGISRAWSASISITQLPYLIEDGDFILFLRNWTEFTCEEEERPISGFTFPCLFSQLSQRILIKMAVFLKQLWEGKNPFVAKSLLKWF